MCFLSSFSCRYSEGDAICQPNGPAGYRHRLHVSTALHPAGGDARTGQLGCQEVSSTLFQCYLFQLLVHFLCKDYAYFQHFIMEMDITDGQFPIASYHYHRTHYQRDQ